MHYTEHLQFRVRFCLYDCMYMYTYMYVEYVLCIQQTFNFVAIIHFVFTSILRTKVRIHYISLLYAKCVRMYTYTYVRIYGVSHINCVLQLQSYLYTISIIYFCYYCIFVLVVVVIKMKL